MLLDRLLPARAADPTAHAAICAALDAVDPQLDVHLGCVAGAPAPLSVTIAGGAPAELQLGASETATVSLHFTAAFGRAASITPDTSAQLTLSTPEPNECAARLGLPLGAAHALVLGERRFVAVAELSPPA